MADDATSPVKSRRRSSTASAEPSCLYPDEKEIALAVLGPSRAKNWRGLAVVLERGGLPKIDPEFGARYWPAVKAFLDRRHHVQPFTGERRDRR